MGKFKKTIRGLLRVLFTSLGIGKSSTIQIAKHDESDAEDYKILSRDLSEYRSTKVCQHPKEQDSSENQ